MPVWFPARFYMVAHGFPDLDLTFEACGVKTVLDWQILCGLTIEEAYKPILRDALGLGGESNLETWIRVRDGLAWGRAANSAPFILSALWI